MPTIPTPSRRRIAMAALLSLAVAGGVIRHLAPNPSTLRDIGTLLLVLWLPAVGNLVAYLISKIPARPSTPATFAPDAPFTAHLLARLQTAVLPEGWRETLDPAQQQCMVVAGRRGFTARAGVPLVHWLSQAAPTLELGCLSPTAALRELVPGTSIHLLVGSTVVASGVLEPAAGKLMRRDAHKPG